VDLVCERPVASPAEADSFRPHFGGAVANVAVAAAAVGADVALAGGAGDDAWGRWLMAHLQRAGVRLDFFSLEPGTPTPVAFITSDLRGEPSFSVYGEGIGSAMSGLAPRLETAVDVCDALFFSSNTLVGAEEAELTRRARELALERGRPVLFDPNLRLSRWPDAREAIVAANECVPDALLVRCNALEAELLTGEPEPERAARALLGAGARMVVVTLGARGALLRGEASADARGRAAGVLSTVGAGDALMGVLLGRLALAGFYPSAAAAALPEAVEAGARATERWGAVA